MTIPKFMRTVGTCRMCHRRKNGSEGRPVTFGRCWRCGDESTILVNAPVHFLKRPKWWAAVITVSMGMAIAGSNPDGTLDRIVFMALAGAVLSWATE
jgi:hypothetical protein